MKTIRCVDHYGKWHEIPAEKLAVRLGIKGVLEESGKFLLVKDKWEKKWEFPGGGIQAGELINQALKRELLEETGIEVEPIRIITVLEEYFYAEDRDEVWQSIRLFYRVKRIGGELQSIKRSEDSIEACFMSKNDLNAGNAKQATLSVLPLL